MDKIINVLILLLLLGSCIFNVVLVSDLNKKTMELIKLTDIEPEIIFLDSLVYDTVYIEKTEIVRLPIYHIDTLTQTDTLTLVEIDSVDVVLPIELKQFNDTLLNTAISFDLSGFQCKVNNLYVENLKTSVIKENKPKRWGIGVQLGVGGCKDGFSPYIGLGISYNLFSF
jgi:hypothetical protein